jgi:hypothetical protein
MNNAEKFNEWMRSKVKSLYYPDNLKMINAFEKINQNDRELKRARLVKSSI